MERRGGKDERRLHPVRREQPRPAPRARDVAQLPEEDAAADEAAETHARVREVHEVAADAQRADGEEGRVARLVGGEDVVVREAGGVHDARGEREGEEFELEEEVDCHVLGEVARLAGVFGAHGGRLDVGG